MIHKIILNRRDGRFLKEKSLTPEKLQAIRALNDLAHERGQTLAAVFVPFTRRTLLLKRAASRIRLLMGRVCSAS